MEKPLLRLLIVDESPDDVEITADVLRQHGYMLKSQRVQDLVGLQGILNKGAWDVIICEHSLAHFNPIFAIDAVKRADLDTPLIVVTKKISDADLVKVMRAGARDVILKSQPVRLVVAIERELQTTQERATFKLAGKTLKEFEGKNRALVETSREAICYSQDGVHLDANRAYLTLFGYQEIGELDGITVLNLIDSKDHAKTKDHFRKANREKNGQSFECTAIKKDGGQFFADISISAVTIAGENCQQIIVSDISKRKAAEQKLQYLAQHDALTGLYNRHYFLQELAKVVEMAKTGAYKGVLLYIDINQLTNINETFGHDVGDRLLLKLGRLFRDKLRPQDLLARLGGDEFTAIMANADTAQAQAAADTILKALKESPLSEGGKTQECTCSISVVEIDQHADSAQKILSKATAANEKNKPQVTQAPSEPQGKPEKSKKKTITQAVTAINSDWQQRIQGALDGDQFHLSYQPIINLHGEPGENYEVLVRMTGDNQKVISAAEFMAAAEQSGQIENIDRWVIQRALKSMAELHAKGKMVRFFINISGAALQNDTFISWIEERLYASQIPASHLIFEIQEQVFGKLPEETANFILFLTRIGSGFAIDNFGNSFCNFSFMKQRPLAFVKIDGAVISEASTDNISQAVIQAMVQIAKTLGMRTVAKYVEGADVMANLWNYGIDYVQGNYFQQANAELNYDFGIENLSSEEVMTSWRPIR